MTTNIWEQRLKFAGMQMRMILREHGHRVRHLDAAKISARLMGFETWEPYRYRDGGTPFGRWDDQLTKEEFAVRYAYRMKVLDEAGFGPVARDLLDRMTKAGCWSQTPPSPAKG
jgi:hypothetical protein